MCTDLVAYLPLNNPVAVLYRPSIIISLCSRARQVQSHDLRGGGVVPMDEEVNYGKEARDLFSAIEVV